MEDRGIVLSSLREMLEHGSIDRRKFLAMAGAAGITAVSADVLFASGRECTTCSILERGGETTLDGATPISGSAFVVDPNTQELIDYAGQLGIELVWDRHPSCRYSTGGEAGSAGLCCFRCQMGPCTLGLATRKEHGACGSDRDIIVARDLVRRIAGGTAAHVEHARAAARVLRGVADGTITDYAIQDPEKLAAVYRGLLLGDRVPAGTWNPIPLAGSDSLTFADRSTVASQALAVAEKTLEDFGRDEGTPAWLQFKANEERKAKWAEIGILPAGATTELSEALHRTTLGVDADMTHLATDGLKLGLVDGYCGLHATTNIQDILFGTPHLKFAQSGLSVLKGDEINIVINGHEPILSEKIVEAVRAHNRDFPLETPINVVGMCCTGNEMLMRKGVNPAGAMVQQELAIATGAVEVMVVDVQCILPNVQRVVEQMGLHTRIITTNRHARISGATHIPFEPESANALAKQVVQLAIDNYPARGTTHLPADPPREIVAGFSVEQILEALRAVDSDPVGFLLKKIADNSIRGIVGVVGCVTPRDTYGFRHVTLSRKLLAENILVVGTGCWAHVAGQYGLLTADPEYPGVGGGLRSVLRAVAERVGLPALPACWHMGSCVDNGRIEDVLNALSARAGVRIDQLPAAASAPEFIAEKAVSIGTWSVDLGLFTHIGGQPYVAGSANLVQLLTEGVESLVGGKFYVEEDPVIAADAIIDKINEKRSYLGWPS